MSDDSDIEVHPNVDKRSFIRAKQNQIHQNRDQRKLQITTYQYERVVNDGLLKRINILLAALESYNPESGPPDKLAFQAMMETAGKDDEPPRPPAGVHTQEKESPTYTKMMAALIDQVAKKVDEDKAENRYEAYVAEIKVHRDKVIELQKNLLLELEKLDKEEHKKITSEGIHTGFDSSYVAPAKKPPPKSSVKAVEVLNPHALVKQGENQQSGGDADIEDEEDDDDEADPQASELGKKFAGINMNDYRALLNFISEHPEVVAEKETDGLLVLAFDAAGNPKREQFAKQCVHNGLLLQYCRALGKDGVGLFFKRITTPGHQAQKVFYDDVNSTFNRIRSRVKEIEKQRLEEEADGAGKEQIQLHAVDPGTTINITVPPVSSEDPAEMRARELFDMFPPGLQRALESRSLEEVNKVLGKMSVDEAEEIVAHLGEVRKLQNIT